MITAGLESATEMVDKPLFIHTSTLIVILFPALAPYNIVIVISTLSNLKEG